MRPGGLTSSSWRYSGSSYVIGLDNVYYPWTSSGGRLQQIKAGPSGTPTSLMNLSYTYDPGGNVLSIVDADAGGTQTKTYTYDSLARLLTGAASGGNGGTYSRSFAHIAIGNLACTSSLGTYHYNATISGCLAVRRRPSRRQSPALELTALLTTVMATSSRARWAALTA
jgi:hypothetical protein